MIAKVSRRSDFKEITEYATKKDEHAQLIYKQNLSSSNDPVRLAAEMELTASKPGREGKYAYHLNINWDKHDMVGADAMTHVAKHMLDKLGFGDHQAVVGEHKDKDHPHIHIIVNRVPVTYGQMGEDGKKVGVWNRRFEWEIIERELRDLERKYGWRQVEGNLSLQIGHTIPDRAGASQKEYHARKRAGKPPKKRGRSWDESHERMHSQLSFGHVPDHLPKTRRQLFGIWRAAEFGDAECQWKMSRVYECGLGVPYSMAIASGWAQLAARQGHAKGIEDFERYKSQGIRPIFPPLPAGEVERKWMGGGSLRRSARPKDWFGEWAGERIGGVELG